MIDSQVGEGAEAEEGVSVDHSDFVSAQVAVNAKRIAGIKTLGVQSVVCVRACARVS